MNLYQRLINEGIELGDARGEAKGLQKGARQAVVRQLTIKFGPEANHLIPIVKKLSPALQELIEEKVVKINSLDEMQTWLQAVSSSPPKIAG